MRALDLVFLAVLAAGLFLGLATSFVTPDFYVSVLSAEDGPFEWATAVFLFLGALICARRAGLTGKPRIFTIVSALGALILLFGAGEEISWGQRVFGWKSGDFWVENNDQAETNLHNLVVGDVKINKLLFGVTLTFALLLYFAVLPWVHARNAAVAAWAARWGVPVPRALHGGAFLASLVIMSLVPTSRSAELGEFALGLLLALVVLRPVNEQAFR